MSVALGEERRSELPLIVFTTLVPASVGMAGFSLLIFACGSNTLALAVCAWALASVGMLASIAHLAKPLRAPRSLANSASSWLSREIAVVGAFWALASGWLACSVLGGQDMACVGALFAAASFAVGVLLLAVIARAYKVSTRPAWCGQEGSAELAATALGAGAAAAFVFCAGIPVPALVVLVLACFAGCVIDVMSHKSRIARLEALASESDERVTLTLERYGKLMPRVRRLWVLEGASCLLLLAAVVLAALGSAPLASWACGLVALLTQLMVHAEHRWLFYEIPVQVRWVARLRK
ncbi:MAG: dimethyl sulfoxide reductase anchor subunit [Eggerthellaceae bacterium]|nr:dimethyl sulfoxide reductase anchor subunit [Eggerthellaceae bacterium]